MKLVVMHNGTVSVFDMVRAESVDCYVYQVRQEDWDSLPGIMFGGEYILCSMYDGYSSCGSTRDWDDETEPFSASWSVHPDNDDEAGHLRVCCPNTDYSL